MSAPELDSLYAAYKEAQNKAAARDQLIAAMYRNVWPMMNYIMGAVHPDIAAEAVTTAALHLDTFRGEARFSSWFYRIVTNYCLKARQTKLRLKEVSIESLSEAELQQIETGNSAETAMDNFFDAEQRLDQLDPEDRQLVTLRLEGRTHAEIAKALGINKDAAKHRWHRLIKRFAKESGELDTDLITSADFVEPPDSAPSAAGQDTQNTASNKSEA